MKILITFILGTLILLQEAKGIYFRGNNKECENDNDCRMNISCVDGVISCKCIKGKCYFS
jgi:hypothetical protein